MRAKTLVIGLDGVPWSLLKQLYGKNLMPFLASLQAQGYSAELKSTVPPMSPTAWTSFATGTNPGQHGVLHFVDLRPGKAMQGDGAQWVLPDTASLLDADKIKGVTIWQLLTQANIRQVILNVPLTYPPHPLNGIMVTGMMTPPHAEIYTYPPALSEELRQAGYEIDLDVEEKDFDFDHKVLVSRVIQVHKKLTDTCLRFMRQEPWDLFMVVFTGTDRLQHHCWKYLMPGSPEYDSPAASEVRPLLERYFMRLDQSIASLVNKAGPGTRVMVLSDHGFGPIHERTVHTLSLLEALGLAGSLKRSPIVQFRKLVEGSLGLTPGQIRRWAKRVLPAPWAAKLDARFRGAQLSAGAQAPAYITAMHSYIGGVYISRSACKEEDIPAMRTRLMDQLQAVKDPETGDLLVHKMYTQDELYSGASINDCPDIVFYLKPGYGLADGIGPNGQLVAPRRRHLKQQGVHRDEGILILNGPGIRIDNGPQENLLDVTATLLYLLEIPIPASMDSRPITRALEPSLVSARPPVYDEGDLCLQPQESIVSQEVSAEDEEKLRSRLRGLGYIE